MRQEKLQMVKKRIIQVVHRATQLVHSNTFLLYRGTQQTFALNASQYLDLADIFFFLSDPSPIIGNACQWLTDSLTNCCLVNLIDVTLACEYVNSKLVEVVTVAHVDDEERVGWGYEVQSWSKFLSLRFADIWLRLWSWCLVKILKMFDQDLCKNLWYDLKKLLW